jgi:UDP-N-acetylglucosamine 2-epimerase (non-hydrolysing)
MHRVMVVYGTRPEAIKVAPLVTALTEAPRYHPIVVVTAQHRQLLDQVNEVFGIEPDVDLRLGTHGQTLADVTSGVVTGLDSLLDDNRPDTIVVQGDTTTTMAAAVAASYHKIPVVHLEAGLRSGDLHSPFPEEINRKLTAQITRLHLAPTEGSRENLLEEGVDPDTVLVTGNTVIDALRWASRAWGDYREPALCRLGDHGRVLVVTAHRRESWDGGIAAVGRALARIAAQEPDLCIVFPIHPNPVVRDAVLPTLAPYPNIVVTEPLHYGDFARLLGKAHLVLTDSGGIQEEAPSLGTPVLVMRNNTERPEAVTAGTAALVGTGEDRIVAGVTKLLHDPATYDRMANAVNPYGDGRAAERALAGLDHMFGYGPPPEPFRPRTYAPTLL